MLSLKQFLIAIAQSIKSLNNTINNKVNRSGDTLSGELRVVIPDGSNHAKFYTECNDLHGNLLSAGALESSLNGNVGFYDYKHGRWVCRDDADGRPHVPVNPAVLNSNKVACSAAGTSFKYTTISGLANWSIVAINFTVYEARQVLFFVRGEQNERLLIDAPGLGRFRGGIYVDWQNNRIGIRAIQAGSNNNYFNNVYFDQVFGIL